MKTILLLGAKSQSTPLESVPAELSRIKQLFVTAPLKINLEYEPYLTKDLLGTLLRQHADQTDILHFAGHSNASQLETNDRAIYSHHIADHIQSWQHKPQLVFLNGCHNAAQVDALLEAGVACVIATHNAIDDQEASCFAHEFYMNLLDKPDKVTIEQAFNRAGSVVLMGEPRKARSLDIGELQRDPEQWDWGLFYQSSEQANAWTLEPKPLPITNFISQKKREQTEQRWALLFERLTGIQTQYDLETRLEEKIRMKYIIEENQKDLDAVEQEINTYLG